MAQRGFTLLELAVVMAILGVLAAIVAPQVTRFLGSGQEEAYKTDRRQIQRLVDSYAIDKANPTFERSRQFPIRGAAKGGSTAYTADADVIPEVIAGGIAGNPQGGTAGGNPIWSDDGDGIRVTAEDILHDEDTLTSTPGWHTVAVTVRGTTYRVDTRDYILDFDRLISFGLLREAPGSAAQDSCSVSVCTGSYIYFIKANGAVETLVARFPKADKTGFQGVYP